MNSFTRSTAIGLLAAILFVTPTWQATSSEIVSAEDGKRKINLSGRQRMLSQRMAKAVCFAAVGVQTDAHLAMGKDAHALFDKTLTGLRDGDSEQGMNAEVNPKILAELDSVDALWVQYGKAVSNALAGPDAAAATLGEIAALNVPTLVQMNKAVGAFERHYGASSDIHPALALALNISGRQRMLSQKASKEFCLIVAGQNADESRAALAKTVALFEQSLLGLMDGDDELGLPEAPTDEIYDQLELVSVLWAPLKVIFDKVIAGEMPTDSEIAKVANDNNPLLVEMNKAVWMYDIL